MNFSDKEFEIIKALKIFNRNDFQIIKLSEKKFSSIIHFILFTISYIKKNMLLSKDKPDFFLI